MPWYCCECAAQVAMPKTSDMFLNSIAT